jgi:predicted ribosome quality control (RQC) complex YloA/Tae2 family protein
MLSTAKWLFIGIMDDFQYIVHNIMLSNYHTLFFVSSALHSTLQNRRISQIYTQTADEMVISFEPGVPSLVFCCESELVSVFLHEHATRAKSNSADLLTEAWGRSVAEVRMHPSDRVLTLVLASGDRIALQFFAAQSNAFLIDVNDRICDAFKKPRQFVGKGLSTHERELVFDFTGLAQELRSSPQAKITGVLRTMFPTLGSTLLREILVRSSLPFEAIVGDTPPLQLDAISLQVRRILAEVSLPSPRIYYDRRGIPSVFSIIPLTQMAGSDERTFDDVHEALRTFVFRRRAGARLLSGISELHSPLRRALEKLQRTKAAMDTDAREASRAEEYERHGSLLMANLVAMRKGATDFTVEGTTIRLDPTLTPVQNAQRYFDRAKRARAAAGKRDSRFESIDDRLGAARALLEDLDLVASQEDLQRFRATHEETLSLFGLTPETRAQAELPFRLFRVDGGFEVWAGKSSQNNDLLTMKHARPNDLWFHARGSSGSHVVLKIGSGKGTPGKRAIEQAAAIAAYYSKMKTSSLVPVAVTERKYVRKPRGAAPGTVVLERERTLFVKPQLPSKGPGAGA